ncbi:WD repeat-containing protein wrap73 [Entophlyctis luteolus]|nr:WD repeat-containing protein wrap73 [Entophlyctis luteolus]
MTRFAAVLLALIAFLASVARADRSNYGDVHREAAAFKEQALRMLQRAKGDTGVHQGHIKAADDMVLFFQLHDLNKDGHLDGHELLTVYANQEVAVGSDGRPTTGSAPPAKLSDLVRLVDTALDMDDTDNDGMISWSEYFASQLATAVDHRLVVRDAETLQIIQLFTCTAAIDVMAWAGDSQLILVASKQKKAIQANYYFMRVWSLADIEWKCCIDEGVAGLVNVIWAPDARHLLVFSDFQLRITVWSLVTKDASYIQYPKYSNKGFCFRKDGRYFALSERKDCKDTVSIYDCDDWTLLKALAL